MKYRSYTFTFLLALGSTVSSAQDKSSWQPVSTASMPMTRSENAYVQVGNKFYLVGGRGLKPIDACRTSRLWEKKNPWK